MPPTVPTLSAGEACDAVVAAVPMQPTLRMPLAETLGHVLADDLVAPIALPPWTNAAMDGYAVLGDDVRGALPGAPARLRVVGTTPAGTTSQMTLGRGEARRVYTGAPVPPGADSVIRQEDTDRGTEFVLIHDARDAGANVRHAGADLPEGALALPAGTVIGPHQLALLAALAAASPVVYRKPRVGILTSGDELVGLDRPEEILAARKLADVNGPALAALVTEAGGIAVPLGIAHDDAEEIRASIAAATDVDLVITAGGVSVGDFDHLPAVMAALGATLLFRRVRIRPGGPTAFGLLPDGRAWLGLPGNPVSAMVTFELFGRPAIRRMAGHRTPRRATFPAVLTNDVVRDPALDQYLRCTFSSPPDGGPPRATLTGPQGSGMLTSVARSDGLVLVPAGAGRAEAGAVVSAQIW